LKLDAPSSSLHILLVNSRWGGEGAAAALLQHTLVLHSGDRPVFISLKMLPLFDEAWHDCGSSPEDLEDGWALVARWAQQNKLKISVFDDQHGQWWSRSGEAAARSEAVPRGTQMLFFPGLVSTLGLGSTHDATGASTGGAARGCVYYTVEGLLGQGAPPPGDDPGVAAKGGEL